MVRRFFSISMIRLSLEAIKSNIVRAICQLYVPLKESKPMHSSSVLPFKVSAKLFETNLDYLYAPIEETIEMQFHRQSLSLFLSGAAAG